MIVEAEIKTAVESREESGESIESSKKARSVKVQLSLACLESKARQVKLDLLCGKGK